ncbi:conserved hypothetical protein [Parafrankia sp. EUN1f]|nr:conserved hypothetical protein [Parafrankia sp. EUN1f]
MEHANKVDRSPPRAWGGPGAAPGNRRAVRITPTGVGRTTDRHRPDGQPADHPHGRGEDTASGPMASRTGGSPPRAWGGPRGSCRGRYRRRITPTGVGRTQGDHGWVSAAADHPHGRGEDDSSTLPSEAVRGSPPRAWGGLREQAGDDVLHRITPTGVGRTAAGNRWPSSGQDHPHGRGEDRASIRSMRRPAGSPPRAWGGPPGPSRPRCPCRITPTGVGRTSRRASPAPAAADHPHGRGEDTRDRVFPPTPSGSPPRAWGGHFLTWSFRRAPAFVVI